MLFNFRQLALKALNERLKRVEDQVAWPSMDEDDKDDLSDMPLLPETSRSNGDDSGAAEHNAFPGLSSGS